MTSLTVSIDRHTLMSNCSVHVFSSSLSIFGQEPFPHCPIWCKCLTRVEHLGGKGLVQLELGVIIAVKRPKTSPNKLMIFI